MIAAGRPHGARRPALPKVRNQASASSTVAKTRCVNGGGDAQLIAVITPRTSGEGDTKAAPAQ